MTDRREGPSAAARIRVMKRDRFTCTYCGAPGTDAELEVDHIVPVTGGGSHHISNLTTACRMCNQKKGARPAPKRLGATVSMQKEHPLVGMCLHSFKDDGAFYLQGQVFGVDGDVVLVQLYSWMDGGPTRVEKLDKAYLYSDRVTLYSCHEDMNIAWERHCDVAHARQEEVGVDKTKARQVDFSREPDAVRRAAEGE